MGAGSAWGSREELLHPRDSHGRFRSSWKMAEGVVNKIMALLDKFNPKTFASDQEAQNYVHGISRGRGRTHKPGIDSFLRNFANVNKKLEAGDTSDPSVKLVDSEMQPIPDDLILTRTMTPESFGLNAQNVAQIEELTGKLVNSKGYTSTNIGTPEARQPGRITMTIATPAGTKALIPNSSQPSKEVVLGRDQPLRVTKVDPDGAGGWNVLAVAAGDSDGETPVDLAKAVPGDDVPETPEVPAGGDTSQAPANGTPGAGAAIPARTGKPGRPAGPGPGPRNDGHVGVVGPGAGASTGAGPEGGTAEVPAVDLPETPESGPDSRGTFREAFDKADIKVPTVGTRRKQFMDAYNGVASGKKTPQEAVADLDNAITMNKKIHASDLADGTDPGPLPEDIKRQQALRDLIAEHFNFTGRKQFKEKESGGEVKKPVAKKAPAKAVAKKAAAPEKAPEKKLTNEEADAEIARQERERKAAIRKEMRGRTGTAEKAPEKKESGKVPIHEPEGDAKATRDQWLKDAGVNYDDLSDFEKVGVNLAADQVASGKATPASIKRRFADGSNANLKKIGDAVPARRPRKQVSKAPEVKTPEIKKPTLRRRNQKTLTPERREEIATELEGLRERLKKIPLGSQRELGLASISEVVDGWIDKVRKGELNQDDVEGMLNRLAGVRYGTSNDPDTKKISNELSDTLRRLRGEEIKAPEKAPEVKDVDLDKMTVAQLRAEAKRRDIRVPPEIRTKADIVAHLKLESDIKRPDDIDGLNVRIDLYTRNPQKSPLERELGTFLTFKKDDPGWSQAKKNRVAQRLNDYMAEEGTASPWRLRKPGPEEQKLIKDLDEVFEKSPIERDMTMWRGIHRPENIFTKEQLDGDLKGLSYADPGFVSTSPDRKIAEQYLGRNGVPGEAVLLQLDIPKGTKGLHLADEDQDEVLLERGLKFDIVSDSGPGSKPRVLRVRVSKPEEEVKEPQKPTEKGLIFMTVPEIRQRAKDKNLKIPGDLKTKKDIVDWLADAEVAQERGEEIPKSRGQLERERLRVHKEAQEIERKRNIKVGFDRRSKEIRAEKADVKKKVALTPADKIPTAYQQKLRQDRINKLLNELSDAGRPPTARFQRKKIEPQDRNIFERLEAATRQSDRLDKLQARWNELVKDVETEGDITRLLEQVSQWVKVEKDQNLFHGEKSEGVLDSIERAADAGDFEGTRAAIRLKRQEADEMLKMRMSDISDETKAAKREQLLKTRAERRETRLAETRAAREKAAAARQQEAEKKRAAVEAQKAAEEKKKAAAAAAAAKKKAADAEELKLQRERDKNRYDPLTGSRWTMAELRKYAQANGFRLPSSAVSKDDVRKAIIRERIRKNATDLVNEIGLSGVLQMARRDGIVIPEFHKTNPYGAATWLESSKQVVAWLGIDPKKYKPRAPHSGFNTNSLNQPSPNLYDSLTGGVDTDPNHPVHITDFEIYTLNSDKRAVIKNGLVHRRDGVTYLTDIGDGDPNSPYRAAMITYSFEEFHNTLPPGSTEVQSAYAWIRDANPNDDYWKAQFNSPDHESFASAGNGTVAIWGRWQDESSQATARGREETMTHEYGHNVDNLRAFALGLNSEGPQWKDATQKPVAPKYQPGSFTWHEHTGITMEPDADRGFPNGVTTYGKSSVKEDFAESMELYWRGILGTARRKSDGKLEIVYFRDIFPERAAILDKLFPAFASKQKAERVESRRGEILER